MEHAAKPTDWDQLTTDEKIQRVQDLWDDICESGADDELTDEQRTEIERRLREHEESPRKYATWEEVRARLEGKR